MKAKSAPAAGFTLVELLVGCALLITLLLILTGIVNQTTNTWRFTTTKVEEFRSSRTAFESLTRRLSQATLNTYWDYQYTGSGLTQTPSKYIRQSDLKFYAGSMETITGSPTPIRPCHSIFFQAPLGFTDKTDYSGLGNLLNTWGYYLEFNTDAPFRPDLINGLNPPLPDRYRFRLMELMQPSNDLNVYHVLPGKPFDWVNSPLNVVKPNRATHPLAENVVALVILPRLSEGEKAASGTIYPASALAPKYVYDSTATSTATDPELDPKNQLPPLVQVTLVAIDEPSAARLANGTQPPDLGTTGATPLFNTKTNNSASQYAADLQTLETTLSTKRVNYRVFTTTVSIRAAKWSRN